MDKYKDLDLTALAALQTERRKAFDALIALEAPTVAQVDEATALAAELDEINTEVTSREEAANEAAERFAALKTKFSEAPAEDEPVEEEPEEEETPEEEPEPEATPEATQPAQAAVKTAAKAKGVTALAAKTKRPAAPARTRGNLAITAAADVQGFASGSTLDGIEALGQAIVNRTKGFTPPTGDGTTENLQKFGVATFSLPFESDMVIDRGTDDMEVLTRASQESRLEGGSLVAAGGWCSPSETLYDLCAEETQEGLITVPEIGVKRGGINYTTGPDFADFYGNANGYFVQTETQAIAGATKPCVTVDCPDFDEVRLDAVGLCIKIPILTNATYPELIQRYTSGFLTAWQHRRSADIITRMLALSPAARVLTGLGSSVDDTLEGLSLVADQERQKRRLSMSQSLEVVLPFWTKNMFKADLRRRNNQDSPVTDQQLTAHFSAANLAVQYVYNWQDLDLTAEVYPATFNALMYPAGTFVVGAQDIINLNTVYDAASLAVNTYTGLFMEQGLLVAKMCGDANLVTVPTCNAGRRGALDVTCA